MYARDILSSEQFAALRDAALDSYENAVQVRDTLLGVKVEADWTSLESALRDVLLDRLESDARVFMLLSHRFDEIVEALSELDDVP